MSARKECTDLCGFTKLLNLVAIHSPTHRLPQLLVRVTIKNKQIHQLILMYVHVCVNHSKNLLILTIIHMVIIHTSSDLSSAGMSHS